MTNITRIVKNIFASVVLTVMGVVSILSISSVSTVPALAQKLPSNNQICSNIDGGCKGINNASSVNDLPGLAARIAQILTFIIASIAIIFIVWGSFVWMTQEKDGAERGRKIIFNAVIALVISILAYSVVQVLINVLSTLKV